MHTHTHQLMQLHCTMWIRADWGPGDERRDDDERWWLGRCPSSRIYFLSLLKYTETRTQLASSPHHTVSRIGDGRSSRAARSLSRGQLIAYSSCSSPCYRPSQTCVKIQFPMLLPWYSQCDLVLLFNLGKIRKKYHRRVEIKNKLQSCRQE